MSGVKINGDMNEELEIIGESRIVKSHDVHNLENALSESVTSLLLELRTGFAFIGR